MMSRRGWLIAASIVPLLAGSAAAQQGAREAVRTGCSQASPTAPATPPARGAGSGTAPGGMGSTGWSGGTGGSHIGTAPAGPTPGATTTHPDTASGLDPTRPEAQRPSPC